MIYDVEWLDEARLEVEAVWARADEGTRASVARAIAKINDRLAIAPYTQGESRDPADLRIIFELPVRAYYRIERFSGVVVVLNMWVVQKRPRR